MIQEVMYIQEENHYKFNNLMDSQLIGIVTELVVKTNSDNLYRNNYAKLEEQKD